MGRTTTMLPLNVIIGNDQGYRVLHMLLTMGRPLGTLDGDKVFVMDGRAYVVTSAVINIYDYHEFMSGVRDGTLNFT